MKQKVQSGHRVPFIPELCKPSEYWDEEGHEETMVWWRQACLKSFTLVEHFMFTFVPHFGLWKGTPCECLGSCLNLNFISIIHSARFSKT